MNNIRNFCIIAHIDAGKSTLADRFLELTGTIDKREMKEQVLDQMDLERERGITIKLQPVRMAWRPSRTNADLTRNYADETPTCAEGLLYEDLTYKIRGCVFKVKKEVGLGHKESVYQKALEEEFRKSNLYFEREKTINIIYNSRNIGIYRPDFIIDGKIIIELKSLPFIGNIEKKQIWTYLKGSEYKLALLVNFAPNDIYIKRIIYDTAREIQRKSGSSPRQSASVVLNLIDTPGHVDFSYEVSRSLAAVEGAILLVDATQGVQAQTLANLYQAQKLNLDIIPVINKIDLPNTEIEKTAEEISNLLKVDKKKILKVSAKTGAEVENILSTIVQCIKPPPGEPKKPLRALVFDSVYDSYRGVIAYVRIVDGQVQKGDKIKLMATGAKDEALEVGYFTPKFHPADSLQTGEIGYIVTGLKDISQCRVGDTITTTRIITDRKTDKNGYNISYNPRKNPFKSVLQPLAGYKEPQPMVFAGVYSTGGEVEKLREAIGKLKLNDSSLFYEPENSKAFGFGFRCGFLGLLHLEIFKERLEREYDLNLIITTPQVAYKGKRENGKNVYEEPWAKLEVISPPGYIGKIMEYISHVRGIYKETEYLGNRVVLKYEAPLSAIIIGMHDKLKSLTSGYASMSYEFKEYKIEDLVKMEVIIAGEKVDVLSQIVHQAQLYSKAHTIVKRLKELVPRQMFQVSIQAAVGGKILAREDISAMKKDVTGYLYGGDVTRKKKLLEKQKRGKRKMKKLGKVNIPTDVFINLLKT